MEFKKIILLLDSKDEGDNRIAMEHIQKAFNRRMPGALKDFLYNCVKSNILDEYCQTSEDWEDHEDWECIWREDE